MDTEKTINNNFSSILITLIVLIVTCVIFYLFQRRRVSRRGVLLTGLCDSGKTVLFSQLVHGKYVNTQTSMKENFGEFITNDGVLKIIDIPGYERLREKFIDQYKLSARCVVYVVDSSTIQKNLCDAAEFLYNILTDPVIAKSISTLLIVCNKQDIQLAKSITAIKSLLEKELNALRITKSRQLESVDPKESTVKMLGKDDKNFTFSSLSMKTEFVEANGLGDGSGIADIRKWLTNLC